MNLTLLKQYDSWEPFCREYFLSYPNCFHFYILCLFHI
nr:MAG TPA: putative cellulose synthase [Bacteriophage sp.]